MKIQIFISFLFVLSCLPSFSQSVMVSGRLVDPELKEWIKGAAVYGADGVEALTNNDGYFSIEFTSCKPCVINIRYLGYEELDLVIHESEFPNQRPQTLDLGFVSMKQKSTRLKEVQVSDVQSPYRGTFEGTNYYISPRVMKDVQPMATEEVLRAVPGVNVIGDMGLSNRPNISIRGSWGRRSEKVLMLEDGSPISPAPYIAPGIYYNPISDRVDGIEVYTGADILRYGPNNMYGIINYLTPKPAQVPTFNAKVAGGQRGFFTGLLSYSGTWNGVGASIEGVYKRFDGFTQNSATEMLNFNAKIFAELSKTQSLYFKISAQFEDNKATLASITPFTFKLDPTQNPFDADRFTMHRYGLDVIHKYAPGTSWSLTSKLFASDFARDWWRQINAVIPASEAKKYLGEQNFIQRFSYLNDIDFDQNDMVRVGRVLNGRESTTDSRWHFTVAGLEETFSNKWNNELGLHGLDINMKLHRETYTDMLLQADSSRWARSGQFTRDIAYELLSLSGYIRYQFTSNDFSFTPILRVETVGMNKFDRLNASLNPGMDSPDETTLVNRYTVWLPGFTASYNIGETKFFASIYQGYIAPSKNFAFLVERDGIVTVPDFGEVVNMKPEMNVNFEGGFRGSLIPGRLQGQVAYFNNTIRNFYLAGWNEFFDKLGVIKVHGLEAALRYRVLPEDKGVHKLFLQPNFSILRSRVLSGEMIDRHLFSQIVHSPSTKLEFVNKVNKSPQSYRIIAHDGTGHQVQLDAPITVMDLDRIVETTYIFGEGYIENASAPYSPEFSFYLNANYHYKDWQVGLTWNFIGSQYTEFANFENESSDGAVGKLNSFQTLDFNLNYDFKLKSKPLSVFIVGKNLQNRIFRMSRLNRANSGIFPGGFRQINIGLYLTL